VAFLLSCSYSYSEIKNDISKNAAADAMAWTMQNILPYSTGLTVDGVIYQYTTVKNQADPMGVTIQNANSNGSGYVFRNRDDWTGLRGNTITKVVPVDNIPGNLWGRGEINIDGIGEVKNTSVVYKYRYDTCIINPLSSPACPGYAEAMARNMKVNEPIIISDEIKNSSDSSFLCLPTDVICLENKAIDNNNNEKLKKKDDSRKSVITNLLLNQKDDAIASQLEVMSAIPELYKISIPGGAYKDVPSYPEKSLPDNRNGRRLGFAQERLHQTMVDSQYEIKE
jgi:hypothetical protein